ncbi:ferrous iron transport protein A [Blastopirellula sp. JC732]|uniref:Ferrous iron transport protein A n=1 Tax=Blastopirellula sediminis TaxID=2894196 RepID=A0A9X1SGJ5_9BACT|nr:ferrous iron transport protein A [Blastopirellula sediminis]MCC9607264.1 ferrous iron transport protein A [Blastopirellula sediminis]MCC9629443.1 ferrous iron transport protein A [Blastopirellula sediminis]
MKTLSGFKVGDRVTVSSIEGDDDISVRLLEMGLVPGVELEVVGYAPLGDPIEIELIGYRLSLRKSEASRVLVTDKFS